jgi:hypothetical protein
MQIQRGGIKIPPLDGAESKNLLTPFKIAIVARQCFMPVIPDTWEAEAEEAGDVAE